MVKLVFLLASAVLIGDAIPKKTALVVSYRSGVSSFEC